MLLRLPYLALTSVLTAIRLLPMSDTDKDIETSATRPPDLGDFLRSQAHAMGARKGTRSLTCREQAIFGLRWFRERGDIPKLGRDHGISQATAYRYPGRLSTTGVGGISGAPQAISTAY